MRIKIAVIGAGSMGMNHLRVLSDFDEEQVQLVGVADTFEPSLGNAVSRFHVVGFAEYREMIDRVKPDLVAVVIPTHLHFEAAAYALERGINVLLEKPMARTVEQALALIQLAHRRGVKLAVGHVERFNPAISEV